MIELGGELSGDRSAACGIIILSYIHVVNFRMAMVSTLQALLTFSSKSWP